VKKIDLNGLQTLRDALGDVIGYLTDNSCSDPDCCGGPFYEREDFQRGCEVLKLHGLEFSEK
jgi:hypothetical protein